MDAQQTYLLNGLLTRNFGLGRIVRFREVERGRQASTFELFTAQENEYLVYLYPAGFPPSNSISPPTPSTAWTCIVFPSCPL